MILLCGIASERPLELLRERLEEMRVPFVVFHQRRFEEMGLWFEVTGGEVTGELTIGTARYRLEDFTGVYTRLMDDQRLPELKGEREGSPRRQRCRALHDTLMRWYEIAPARVVNRTRSMESNSSKPYQAQLILRHGFHTPETLVTSDPEEARAFYSEHGKVIYKSISGARSIVQTLRDGDLDRLDRLRFCPVQFQEYVEGDDVRVHTVGNEVFATGIQSSATDYRYAQRQTGETAALEEVELPDDVRAQCLRLSGALELPMAGIDLRFTPGGKVYCFEVNPSPAYSYYATGTGQRISDALARYLNG